MQRDEWTLHLTTSGSGHGPEFAWLCHEDEDGQVEWVADAEFGPFDRMSDVLRFLVRSMSTTKAPSAR